MIDPDDDVPREMPPGAVPLIEGKDYHFTDNPDCVRKLFVLHKQHHVAAMFSIGVRTFREWLAAGCPGKPGHYVTADILQWRLERDAGRKLCRECMRPV